jgi:hypothetical protein
MGMYDSLHIDPARLPIGHQEQEQLKTADFQTKSVVNILADLYITDEGYLEMDHAGLLGDADEPISSTPIPFDKAPTFLPFQNERVRLIDAHGSILFYTTTDAGWYQFNAVFANGRLVSIVQESPFVADGASRVWEGKSCRWSQEAPIDLPEP